MSTVVPVGTASSIITNYVEDLAVEQHDEVVFNFTDIAGHWAEEDIRLLAGRGFIKGVGDDLFAPAAKITRAEFATLLVRILGLTKETSPETIFTDVTADNWFYEADNWFYESVETAAKGYF